MEIPKLITLLCCASICLASHYTHTIPVEGYETELQDLGQHVEVPETPVKVIKITKTIAVKIPVPYPVKVVEKVPYPVHVNKPYPVPVPHIVKVPVAHNPSHGQEALDVGHGSQFQNRQHDGNSYQVQESPHDISTGGETHDGSNSYDEGNHENSYGANGEENNQGGSYYAHPSQDIHGFSGDQDGHNSYQSNSYDQAIQNYLSNLKPNENIGGSSGYH
ncbi:uncharacterized protein LOC125077270 [Vanessa atalanta]|uniref:uncharacterized protein LOC125077270 n=1 Tax=Vanessa atalanta TaxID=42275 RepID=UPI001FCE17BC|nr:uncharacterized protein LOC125077270 [Vanessa atalanta]